MPHLPAPRARRLLPLLHLPIIVALLLGTFTAVPPTRAAQTGLTWPDGSTFTSFGGNEVITIDLGIMQFVNGCPTGINDFIYPFADVYVMPSGSVSQGSQLVDVVGRPNTVMGASGGIFVSEVIGATGPGGPIGPGTYAVVYDECQDGTFDANDSLFDPAFEVTIPANLPPINPLASMKAEAAAARDEWRTTVQQSQVVLSLLIAYDVFSAFASRPLNPRTLILYMATSFYPSLVLGDPKEAAMVHILNTAQHYAGLAADPPDYAYDRLTPLPPRQPLTAVSNDPLQSALVALGHASGNEAAISAAALAALERYQGADADGSGEWGLIQARAGRDYARLLRQQLAHTNAALADLQAALAADGRPLDTFAADLETERLQIAATGFVTEQVRLAQNIGLDAPAIDRLAADFIAQDFSSYATASFLTTLADRQAGNLALMAELDTLAADWQAIVTALENDPLIVDAAPRVDAGSAYTGTVGMPLLLDGSGSLSQAPPAAYAWDLDGDGAFDDAAGITATTIYTRALQGLVGLQVTDAAGRQNVAYAFLTITDANRPAQLAPFGPAARAVTVTVGAAQPFTVTLSDPDGDPVTGAWLLDGTAVASGDQFTYAPQPADAGAHSLALLAVDDQPDARVIVRQWEIFVLPGDADGDGWHLNVDCDDADPAVHPGAPEILFNGMDDDCDPTTPDIGTPAVVNAGADVSAVEGDVITLTAAFTDSNPANTHTAVFTWGDGAVTTGTVAAGTATAGHAYGDDGAYPISVCLTDNEGAVGCDTLQAVIANAAPVLDFVDLFKWRDESYAPLPGYPAGDWVVAADGQSVLQTQNGQPTFFYSDFEATQLEIEGYIQVSTTTDDDFIGFAFGFEPGDTTNPNAEYLLVDWKKATQTATIGCQANPIGLAGLAVSRVFGVPDAAEFWQHDNFDGPNCPDLTQGVEELARANTLGSTGWSAFTEYKFTFQYGSDHLRVFVDDVLELDVSGSFPIGRLAFYNFSQGTVRYRAFDVNELTAVEGTPLLFTHLFADAGALDTHTALIDWGDGTPADRGAIGQLNGTPAITATHRYADDGSYTTHACVTDDDGAAGCNDVLVTVANAPPVVSAGADQTVNAALTLHAATFADAGTADTHTAAISWGDGLTSTAGITGFLGTGLVLTTTHVYSQSGVYDVQVCVTDDDGAAGCDGLVVTATTVSEAPAVTLWHANVAAEGDIITHTLSFTQRNAAYTHTGTLDWGDGGGVQPLPITNAGGAFGFAELSHVYLDDAAYTAEFTVCNDAALCTTVDAVETIVNLPPVVSAGAAVTVAHTLRLTDVTFVDAGVLDVHTAVINWGDGTSEAGVVSEIGGAGTVAGTHTYAQTGSYAVEVCVLDDDGGQGCAALAVSVIDVPITYLQFLPLVTQARRD